MALALVSLVAWAQDGIVQVAQDAALPHMAADADGGVYVVFYRNGNIELAVSTDRGKTFSPPVTAIDAGKKAAAFQGRGPRVAVDRQKRVSVTAPLASDAKNPGQFDLWIASSNDRGQTWTKPQRVNDAPLTEPQHAIAAGQAGEVLVAWIQPSTKGQDLMYLKVGDPSRKGGKPFRLAANVCERCAPGIAADGRGLPFVIYREGGDAKKIRQIEFWAGPGSKPVQVNSADTGLTTCPQDPPALAVSTDGKTVAAAWMDTRADESDANVYLAFLREGKLGRDTRVNDDARFYQGRPSVALDPEGVAWIAWEDGRNGTQEIWIADSKSEKNVSFSGKHPVKAGHPTIAVQGSWRGVTFELGSAVAFRALGQP
jgi:hypothetical protein